MLHSFSFRVLILLVFISEMNTKLNVSDYRSKTRSLGKILVHTNSCNFLPCSSIYCYRGTAGSCRIHLHLPKWRQHTMSHLYTITNVLLIHFKWRFLPASPLSGQICITECMDRDILMPCDCEIYPWGIHLHLSRSESDGAYRSMPRQPSIISHCIFHRWY